MLLTPSCLDEVVELARGAIAIALGVAVQKIFGALLAEEKTPFSVQRKALSGAKADCGSVAILIET